jgi:hypothetical protein
MENKTTTELLDLLWKIEKQDDISEEQWKKYDEALAELRKRSPFKFIGINDEKNESHDERLEDLEGDVKLLKRHKHDAHNGDVLTRI